MGEAEDAIRRRQQLSASTAELAERATTSRAIHDRDSLVRRVEGLAPRALEGLRARSYPGGQIFRAYKGSFRRKQLAGWPVGGFAFKDKEQVGPDRINSIYLLSDGTWLYDETRKPTSFAEIAAQFEGGLRTPGNLLPSELPVGVIEELQRLAGDAWP